jgi:hypothetical protein
MKVWDRPMKVWSRPLEVMWRLMELVEPANESVNRLMVVMDAAEDTMIPLEDTGRKSPDFPVLF